MREIVLLGIAIITEVFATNMLKLSSGFTVLLPSLGVVFGYGLSFYCLSLCLRRLSLSLAYAVWSGVGTAITTIIGIIFWDDLYNVLTFSGIILIIGGIVLLNMSEQANESENVK